MGITTVYSGKMKAITANSTMILSLLLNLKYSKMCNNGHELMQILLGHKYIQVSHGH